MTENVNTPPQMISVVNVKLGRRMRAILVHLSKLESGYGNRQDHIIRTIEGLYGQKLSGDGTFTYSYDMSISRSLRSSYCRAFRTLLQDGLIITEKNIYQYEYKGRPLYSRWDGKEYVQVRATPKPTKTWDSKPWFYITPEGLEYVNKRCQLAKVVNKMGELHYD